MRVAPVTILPSADAASNQLSAAQSVQMIFAYAIAATFTGAPAGTLTLEGSLDGTTYVTISGSSQVISDSGTTIWDINGCGYQFVQCRWVKTGGSTGTVTMKLFMKGF